MCMTCITKRYKQRDRAWKVGYKCLIPEGKNYVSPCYRTVFEPGVTSRVTTHHILTTYESGFHIWKRKRDAQYDVIKGSEKVVKVLYRKCVAEGFHSCGTILSMKQAPCIIAKEMKICITK